MAVLFAVYATTIPWDFSRPPSLAAARWPPLWDPSRGRWHSLPDLAQNLVLFLPIGLFGALATRWPAALASRRLAAPARLAAVVLGATLLSVLLELLQTTSALREADSSDVVANAAGAAVGALLAGPLERRVLPVLGPRARALLTGRPDRLALLALLGLAVGAALAPPIPTLDLSQLRQAGQTFLADPWGTTRPGARAFVALAFAGLGHGLALEHRAAGVGHGAAALRSGLALAALALAVEASRLGLLFQRPELAGAAVHAGAALLGAGLAVRSAPPAASTRGLVFALALPVSRALAPFEARPWQEGLALVQAEDLLPFWALFDRLRPETFANLAEVAVVWAGFGWVVAARRPGGWGLALAAGLAAGLALALELLQLGVSGRTFDPTEALLAALGAGLAARLRAAVEPGPPPTNVRCLPTPDVARQTHPAPSTEETVEPCA